MPLPKEWDLSSQVALVAGDGGGLTPFLAAALGEARAQVCLLSPSQRALEEMTSALRPLGLDPLPLRAHPTRREEVQRAVQEVVGRYGRLDILVVNTQVPFGKPFLEVTEEEFQRVMDTNVKSAFLLCQEAGRPMLQQGRGRIVIVSSVLAERGLWNWSIYCASMGALAQLVRALALEWARSGIRVNGIGPGWFTTKEVLREEQEKDPLVRYLPSRRLGHPRDLVALLVYLCSPACDYATGQTVFVDGGALAHA